MGGGAERPRSEDFRELAGALFDHSLVGIYVIQDGRFAWVNNRTAEIYGYTAEELVGVEIASLTTPESLEIVRQNILARLSGQVGAMRYEIEALTKSRERRKVVVYGSRVTWGRRPAIGGMVLDVTERRQMQEANLRLRVAVEHAENAIFITDPDGSIVYVNPAFERLYDFHRDEVLGKTPRILKSGLYDETFYASFWKELLSGQSVRREIANRAKDGRIVTVESSVNPVRDGSGRLTGFIAVQSDVTARKALEDQVRQSQQLEAIGRLAGGIAHDFNNLLTATLGYTDLLLSRVDAAGGGRDELLEIKRASEQAAAMTRQLLAFSRRQMLVPRVLDLNHVVADLGKILQRLIGENISFSVRLAPKPVTTKADPGQIEQVLLNLVVNARDALPQGGTISVETLEEEPPSEAIREALGGGAGPCSILVVSDDGLGMDAETRSRVFEPFFTTKERGRGTGLGLATVYGIVKQSGGAITVTSAPGKGSEFRVYLPKSLEAPRRRSEERAATKRTGNERILLVEDENSVRRLVRNLLETQGYSVLEARDGEEALALFRSSGRVDVVLSDVLMPRMGGRELARRLAAEGFSVPLVFMSGYSDELAQPSEEGGAEIPLLHKPFLPSDLYRALRTALDPPVE
ncbi:MAG: PAS domain S-box protein [Thermoanaerobaculia bacterium]